jgi:hypothetical protein
MSSVSTLIRRTIRNFRICRGKENKSVFMLEINPLLNPSQWHFILNDKLFANLIFRHHGIPVAHQYGFHSKDH